jgi:hypothetical protein
MLNLTEIKNIIEKMDKYHHVEILKILYSDTNTVLNENNNGIFVNLTDLDSVIIEKLEKYIDYVNFQQENLAILESEKNKLEKNFFKEKKSTIKKSNNKDNEKKTHQDNIKILLKK